MIKKNIAIICPFYKPNLGGVETHLDSLTNYLVSHKYHVTILTYQPLATHGIDYKKYEKLPHLVIYRFKWFGIGWFDKLTPYPALQFLYIVPGLLFNCISYFLSHSRKINIIHAHGFAGAFVTRIVKILYPKKHIVVSTHFIYDRLDPNSLHTKIFRWTLSGFDKILPVSQRSAQELQSVGLAKEKMQVFRYWLDQKKFIPKNKTEYRKSLNLPNDAKLIILFVGRFVKMKGIFNLLKVAKQVPKNIIFLLAGDGPDLPAFKKESQNTTNLILLGRLTHEKVIDYLAACDILILPSLSSEAQPNVIIEALSCGRPVITTDKGSVTEMYDKTVGICINPTSKNIKKIILKLYRDPKIIKNMGKNAKKYAQNFYSDKNAKIITNSYL